MISDEKLLDLNLTCYGCAHSDAHASFPGRPSGERPCGFCVRNPAVRSAMASGLEPGTPEFNRAIGYAREFPARWYGGYLLVKSPMDCYHTVDIKEQFRSLPKAPPSYGHDNPPPGFAPCTRERGHTGPCAHPLITDPPPDWDSWRAMALTMQEALFNIVPERRHDYPTTLDLCTEAINTHARNVRVIRSLAVVVAIMTLCWIIAHV